MLTQERFHKALLEYGIHLAGQKVAIGFSGGGDSVALCHLLCKEKELQDFDLELIYIQHNLRQEASEAEERTVKDIAWRWQIPLHIVSVDVKELANKEKISIETAARKLRYAAFESKKREIGYHRLALAHHGNDQAETVLMHFLRGAGVDGLCGMKGNDGERIRPLLSFSKEEIREYLSAHKLEWVEDLSNRDSVYRRNRLRNEVIPYLEEHFNAGLVGTLIENSNQMAELQEYLQLQTKEAYARCLLSERPLILSISELEKQATYMQNSVIRHALTNLKGNSVNIERKQIQRVRSLLKKQSGKQVNILAGLVARRSYKDLIFCCIEEEKPSVSRVHGNSMDASHLDIKGRKRYIKLIKDHALLINDTSVQNRQNKGSTEKLPQEWIGQNHSRKKWTEVLDADTLPEALVFRYPQPEDYFIFNAAGNRKALKNYLADQKIAAEKRKKIPVIAAGNEIVWVAGERIAYPYRVTDNTKTKIQFTILGRTVQCQKLRKEFQEKP